MRVSRTVKIVTFSAAVLAAAIFVTTMTTAQIPGCEQCAFVNVPNPGEEGSTVYGLCWDFENGSAGKSVKRPQLEDGMGVTSGESVRL